MDQNTDNMMRIRGMIYMLAVKQLPEQLKLDVQGNEEAGEVVEE